MDDEPVVKRMDGSAGTIAVHRAIDGPVNRAVPRRPGSGVAVTPTAAAATPNLNCSSPGMISGQLLTDQDRLLALAEHLINRAAQHSF